MSLVTDRRSAERTTVDVSVLLGDPSTRVVAAVGDRFAATDEPRLVTRSPLPEDLDADVRLFLGRDDEGVAVVGVARPAADAGDLGAWRTLREVGPWLPAGDLDVAMTIQGMATWHRTHGFCPRCGAPTEPAAAGWVRRCPVEERELYPRTDPAVIMSVVDAEGRILLSRGPSWPEGRRSVQAGFVEPGESLEQAVRREVAEETGVVVGDVTYAGSQPWPFPASLMTGFGAVAVTTDLEIDPGEVAEAEWWTRADLARAVEARQIALPGKMSIARRLIEAWYGGDLVVPDIDRPGGDAWQRPAT